MMVTKIVNVDLDLYNNTILNLRLEAVDSLPSTATENRMVYYTPKKQIFVYTDEGWISAGERNPTKVSELENDAGYLTNEEVDVSKYYTKDEVDEKIGGIASFEFKVVSELPATGESNYIYLVPMTGTKAKNTKEEYIWVDGNWEMIGTTQFELKFEQDESGIRINDNILQTATESRDGLMTKDQVTELHGKQEKLVAGANIVIEGNVISAFGGSGGSTGVRPTKIAEFGGTGNTEYKITHGFGTYNVLFQIRTKTVPVRFIQADVSAPDENNLMVTMSEPLNEVLVISIMACDKIIAPVSEEVETEPVETESATWTYINETGKPMYVQLFDENGNEIRGDVTQESTKAYSPVVASLTSANKGTMLVKAADAVVNFIDRTNVTIDVTQYGYTTDDMFLVQIYVDGTGRSMPDIVQDAGTGIIEVDLGDKPLTGSITLIQATQIYRAEAETDISYTHNLGRVVGAQLYLDGSGQAMADIVCVDANTVEVSSNIPLTGSLLIL